MKDETIRQWIFPSSSHRLSIFVDYFTRSNLHLPNFLSNLDQNTLISTNR